MWVEILLFFGFLFMLFYYYMTKKYHFFDGQGIPISSPSFPYGSKAAKRMFTGETNFLNVASDVVKEFPKEKVIGYFMLRSPRYLINDEELAKRILIKDFEYFNDIPAFPSHDELVNNFMTNLKGNDWKRVRSIVAGIFTSNKLKRMAPFVVQVGKNFETELEKLCEAGKPVNIKEMSSTFTMDSIFTAAFGIEVDSFADPDNIFRRKALTLIGAPGYKNESELTSIFKFVMVAACPFLANDILKLDLLPRDSVKFFGDVIRKALEHRRSSGEKRNDVIDLLIEELKSAKEKKNKAKDQQQYESEFEKNAAFDTSDIIIDDNIDTEMLLVSNALLFFMGGFSTSSDAITICSHALAKNPDLQEKIYDEIVDVIGDGEVTFDKLTEMKYLEKFFLESVREADLLTGLERECTKNYKIPGTNAVIPKGTNIYIYTSDIMHDPKNYVNPDEFDPENYDAENLKNKFANQVFGQGPRNCVGMRYGVFIMKIGMVHMLRKFRILKTDTLPDRLVYTPTLNDFIGGVNIKLERR